MPQPFCLHLSSGWQTDRFTVAGRKKQGPELELEVGGIEVHTQLSSTYK
jgi:hypothetical protein